MSIDGSKNRKKECIGDLLMSGFADLSFFFPMKNCFAHIKRSFVYRIAVWAAHVFAAKVARAQEDSRSITIPSEL
jgi:hypothetical protein